MFQEMQANARVGRTPVVERSNKAAPTLGLELSHRTAQCRMLNRKELGGLPEAAAFICECRRSKVLELDRLSRRGGGRTWPNRLHIQYDPLVDNEAGTLRGRSAQIWTHLCTDLTGGILSRSGMALQASGPTLLNASSSPKKEPYYGFRENELEIEAFGEASAQNGFGLYKPYMHEIRASYRRD